MKPQAAPLIVRTALREAFAQLRAAGVPSHTLAAELLLLHVLGCNRTWIYSHPEEELSALDAECYFALVRRRAAGEPTQHLTGKQEFWGLEFEVTQDVLIPRPETEHVIEVALDRLALRELRAGRKQTLTGEGLQIADIGTGSGCIAIALPKEPPAPSIDATDISPAALAVACGNAASHKVADRVRFLEGDLLGDVPPLLDLVVSNPPYIGRREAATLMREVRDHEPEIALYGGEEGYELYAELITQAAAHVKPGGILGRERGHNSLPGVQPLLHATSRTNVGGTNDLAGIHRVRPGGRT